MKRLLLVFACVAALLPMAASAAGVSGRVTFQSKRGQNPVAAETLVWLEPANTSRVSKRPSSRFQMTTRGKTLLPHVLAIPVGSTVDFPNDDPIAHNLFSVTNANGFDLGLYRKGSGKSHKFETPGIVNVYCNVHPNMSAVVHVMATPYYTFADGTGAYSFTDIPPGKYTVVAWNEQGGTTESVIEVSSAGSNNVSLTIDSRNARLAQHTNKEGKPYHPTSARDY